MNHNDDLTSNVSVTAICILKQNRGTVRHLTLNGFGHRPNTSLHRLYSLKFILPYPQNMEQLFMEVSRVSHRNIKVGQSHE